MKIIRNLLFVLYIATLPKFAMAIDVDYYVFGQIFQISAEDAADESITDANLTGDLYPFAHVRIYNQDSGELLGQADAGKNGQFTVLFQLPSGSSPDIECRVYKVIDATTEQLTSAREGINSYSSIGQYTGVGLKIVSDEIIEYGDKGFRPYPGVGIVFTRVGRVEIPYISQDLTLTNRAVAGLADFTANESRADELGIPRFKQAPFARRLLIYGDLGLPGGSCTGDEIDWYQVVIKKIDESSDPISYDQEIFWQDPLWKTRTEITTVPTLTVSANSEKIGPYDGALDDPSTIVIETDPIDGLYWVNRNVVGVASNVFYSFPDLRVNWVSNSFNGLYEISLVYYKEVGRTADDKPIVQELPMTCFTGSPPAGDADDVALHKLIIRVNNQSLIARFDHILLKNVSESKYFAGEGNDDTPDVGSAYDFNTEGLCDIMHLNSKYSVEIHFVAHHEGQYMKCYNLSAISNDAFVSVAFDSDSFDPTDDTAPLYPLWAGTDASGKSVVGSGFSKSCAYWFDLCAKSRLQNGLDYVLWKHPRRAYYVTP